MYQLSQISGIPKTTVIDICSGKSSINRCNAKTIFQLSRALNCTMEDIMMLDESNSYNASGLPVNKNYLETDLPKYLRNSINKMQLAWNKIEDGKKYSLFDCDYCELQSDINTAEVSNSISSEQAWYLREKYLKLSKENDLI